MCIKVVHFKCVYFGPLVSENSVFRTTYIHNQTVGHAKMCQRKRYCFLNLKMTLIP